MTWEKWTPLANGVQWTSTLWRAKLWAFWWRLNGWKVDINKAQDSRGFIVIHWKLVNVRGPK